MRPSFFIFASLLSCGVSHLYKRENGTIPVYRNSTHCIEDRVEDLLERMTLEEKAGQLFHFGISPGPNFTLAEADVDAKKNSTADLIGKMFLSHFQLTAVVNSGVVAGAFSQWPEPLGLAALRDMDLIKTFANIAREEYVAVGIRLALHPQADLATEPRWSRIKNTWGEGAKLTSDILVAYIEGFQGPNGEMGPRSVATVTKHFPGGGPAEMGEDSHFTYGKNQTYPGNNFEHHLIPFRAAIAVGARQIMPAYARPIGTRYEPVGFAFDKGIVTDLLRNTLGFDKVVLTDFGLITDGTSSPAPAWGMETVSEIDKVTIILEAGCDQFGGEARPELVIELVEKGVINESRIDESARRLMREKFLLGLSENPYVDEDYADKVVGNEYFVREGKLAQRRSYTLLTNRNDILPLTPKEATKFYIEGFNASYIEERGFTVVSTPIEADFAVLRLGAPYTPRFVGLEADVHAGTLEYNATEKRRQAKIYESVPTIVDMTLDRPAAIPEVFEGAYAVLGSYGSTASALMDVLFGDVGPEGKLLFDLPRDMTAVNASMEDVPFDTRDPIFKFGYGLNYATQCSGLAGECEQ